MKCIKHALKLKMQISEDHCWLTLDPDSPTAASSIEVTTDTAAKRGLAATQEAWAGWLYTGGHAVTCAPRRAVAALVNSVNPTVTTGKNGRDSEQLQVGRATEYKKWRCWLGKLILGAIVHLETACMNQRQWLR